MGVIDSTFVHECQVLSTSQDQRLDFVQGSAVFTPGKTLAGSTSKTTGIIKSVVLSSGMWAAGTAAGYLILYAVTGAFSDGETIQDSNTTKGTAKTSGSLIPQTNAVGTPSMTSITLPDDSTYYDCLFEHISTSGNDISSTDAGKVIISSPVVFLPSSAQVREGDFITTQERNWIGTYEVKHLDYPEIPCTDLVDHIEAFLRKVGKRG